MTARLIIVTFDSCVPQTPCYLAQNDGGFPQRKLGQKRQEQCKECMRYDAYTFTNQPESYTLIMVCCSPPALCCVTNLEQKKMDLSIKKTKNISVSVKTLFGFYFTTFLVTSEFPHKGEAINTVLSEVLYIDNSH